MVLAVAVMVVAVLALPQAVFAYYSDPTLPCSNCHGSTTPADPKTTTSGPHGGYTSLTSNCQACHSVHAAGKRFDGTAASDSVLLLPAATITDTCFTCHDSTGGGGVYGNIEARGLAVESSHSVDSTNVVPGGDAETGGDVAVAFTGQLNRLSCDDCHSPHGVDVVAPFLGDRMRGVDDTNSAPSTKLLKVRPTSSTTTATVYGSDWCAGCHKGRLSGGTLHNHPVDSLETTDRPFTYANVAAVDATASLTTTMTTLADGNRGYVMPSPRSEEQTGHAQICQQCHEDARNVGVPGAVATYTVTAPYGTEPSDNPQFQDFPHETTRDFLLLESHDDLCLNCHPASALP
jgi:hypothetical protein